MQIDWLTVIAQIANFLILVWLLQRFLYRPITHAMTQREAHIEERLRTAQSKRSEAEAREAQVQRAHKALEDTREQTLAQARKEASDLKAQLEDDMRADMETKRAAWLERLEAERAAFMRSLQKRAGHQSIEITRQMLSDYASADLTGQVADVFAARLNTLDSDERRRLSDAAAQTRDPARIESDETLPPPVQRTLTRAIHDCISPDLEVQFSRDAEIVLGIRLTIGEQTVEWSATRHLRALETALDEVLDSSAATA